MTKLPRSLADRFLRLGFALLCSCACLFFVSPCGLKASSEHCLRLKQTHFFFGTFTVDLAKDAIRMQNTGRFRWILVSKAPQWDVCVFREDDKIFFTESLEKFKQHGLISEMIFSQRDEVVGDRRLRKIPRTVVPTTYFKQAAMETKAGEETLIFIPKEKLGAEQIGQIVFAAWKMPTNLGFPLVYTAEGDRKDWMVNGTMGYKRQIFITTQSITSVDVDASHFDLPKNFTLAKSIREVVAGTSIRNESDDASELFAIGEKKTAPPVGKAASHR